MVNLDQPHEVRWWFEKWGIIEEELRRLVARYSRMVADIENGILEEAFQVPSR
jgi:hypothetical protein